MSTLYSLRPELQFSKQTHQGKTVVVVKDPATNRYLRFTETQGAILELLRTPLDMDGLAAAAHERFGNPVSPASLEGFLRSLEDKALLDTPSAREKVAELAERKPQENSLLYQRLVSLNPDRVFDWLEPKVQWCFTPAFHVFAALSILAGFVVLVQNADRLTGHVLTLLNAYGLVLIWITIAFVVTLHEFAHGMTCRYFGGRVREIGFMLIYFQPAFYCDVSDAWMFPRRRDRLWVTFAGGYFQLVVWGVAIVVWRLVAEGTLISDMALIVILFAGLQTLFNFNPLIKLDGYYMLSDYLEIPNLRDKAQRALRAWLSGGEEPELAGGNRRPLLVYGGLSLVFSTLLLAFVYVNIYLLATSYFAFAGLIGFLMFTSFTLKRTAAESVAGAKALVTRAALRKHRNLIFGAAFLIAIIVIPWPLRISADFRILPRQEAAVRAETAGTISEVLVGEGARVEAGDVVATLHDFDKEKELSYVTGELAQKRAELELLRAGPRAEEIRQAEALVATKETALGNTRRNIQLRNQLEQTLERKRTELQLAEIEARRTRDLFEAGLGPRVDMEKAETSLEISRRAVAESEASLEILTEDNDRAEDLARRELNQAQRELDVLLAGSRAEEIRQREAEVVMLETQQNILDAELEKTRIRTPISGTVVTPFMERLLNKHLVVGEEICRIVDLERVTAELQVPEIEMAEVRPGSRVVLKARSYPHLDFEGRVDFIAPIAETIGGDRYVKVRSELDNDDGLLRPETTGVAKIYAGRHLVIQLMTRRLVRWVRTEFWDLLP